MSSRNAASIGTLVNAISGGLTSGQTYDLMRQITNDLDEVYTQVNTGPLPTNSAINLLHINPAHIDSPGDSPQLVTSPGNVAFINWANLFIKNQRIQEVTFPEWEVRWTGGTKIGRFGLMADGEALFSSNLYFDGTNWQCDNGNNGVGIHMDGVGNLYIVQMQAGTAVNAMQVEAAKGNLIMDPASYKTPILSNEIIYKNNRSIRGVNAANNGFFQMLGIDANDVIKIAANFAASGKGHLSIPNDTAANLPAAAANQDGTIVIDKTNNRFCFYHSGLRYYVLGTAF